MADDGLKIGVSADMNLAEQEGQKYGEAFVRGAQRAMAPMLGGAVLGNGLPATQMPSNEKSIAGILEKILQSLDVGFGRMVEASGGGMSGGNGAGRPGAGQPAGQPATPAARSGINWGGVVGAVGRFPVESAVNMFRSNFHDTNVVQFAANMASGIPVVGPALKLVADMYENKDRVLGERMDMFRLGGERGRIQYSNYVSSVEGEQMMNKLGIDRNEMFQLFKTATSYGADGRYRAEPLMKLQARYGMGQEGGNLMRTIAQSGGDVTGESRLFASTLAVAIGTQLDRGRWGEAFTAMTRAAQRIQTGTVDREGLVQTQMFVGNMGAQFKGDSAQAARATAMIQDLQGGGGGPLGNIMALRAAGLGSGKTYQEAWMTMQRGAAKGGVGLSDLVKQYSNLPAVKAYLASKDDPRLLTNATFILSMLMPGYKATDIEGMLKSMRKGVYGPSEHDVLVMQDQLNLEHAPLPEKERAMMEAKLVEPSLRGTGPKVIGDSNVVTPGAVDDASGLEGKRSRTGATVQYIPAPPPDGPIAGRGMERYGARDEQSGWPMGPGDKQDPRYKPGWRARRPGDPAHMARDITVGGGRPGAKVYSPMDGVWLTSTPVRANAREEREGFIADMLGDNGVRYRFVHLIFAPGLTKDSRIRAGQFIGTVAGGGTGWTPHLHLEAFKVGKGGKGEHVDPNTTMDATQREIMEGLKPGPGGDPGPAPDYLQPGQDLDPGRNPNPKKIRPEDVVPLASNSVDVKIYVYDGRVSVSKTANSRKQVGMPGSLGSQKKIG